MDSSPFQDPVLGWVGERVEKWSQHPSQLAVGGHPVFYLCPSPAAAVWQGLLL